MASHREQLTTAIIEALRDEGPFEEAPEERAERILDKALQPNLHNYALTVLAASDEALGTHLDLLGEWFAWWTNHQPPSATPPNGLYSRTWTALTVAGRPVPAPGDAKPQVNDHPNKTEDEPVRPLRTRSL